VALMELHQAPDQPFAVPVTRRSPEWGWLEYLLHASCAWEKLGKSWGEKFQEPDFRVKTCQNLRLPICNHQLRDFTVELTWIFFSPAAQLKKTWGLSMENHQK